MLKLETALIVNWEQHILAKVISAKILKEIILSKIIKNVSI